jgi:hypothetical protein
MKSVYLETSFVSYLAALPSRDLVNAARQQISWDWWKSRRNDFEVFISQLVLNEISRGDPDAVRRRVELVKEIRLLKASSEVDNLAKQILEECNLPQKAGDDAYHLALATVHGVDFLLTWNCKHLANAELIEEIVTLLPVKGYTAPVICTPDELMERKND